MKILITGAKGFIGKNLTAELKNRGYNELYEYDAETGPLILDDFTRDCGFVYHLAGVNRPKNPDEYRRGNFDFTRQLLESLKNNGNSCPVVLSSSVQAALKNPYGDSKRGAEELLFAYGRETGARVLVYRFPNVFGKWCRPNYNSAVATFCHNIARGLPVDIRDRDAMVTLTYIDDVVDELIRILDGQEYITGGFCAVPAVCEISLGEIADLLYRFKNLRLGCGVPDTSDGFEKKLYSTYLSYLPADALGSRLPMRADPRGFFSEIIRTDNRGQFSVSVTKPGETRGNHWHRSKNERFLVAAGRAVIRLRNLDGDEISAYEVSGEDMEAVDVPPGYTHNIKNTGDTDLILFIWASEAFDPENPDTYYMKV